MAATELEKDMQSQSTPLAMENVRRVLDSRFERLSKNTDISDNSGEKALAAWVKKQYKGICGKCGEMATLPIIARTVNKTTTTDSIPKHKPKATTGSVTLMIKLPEIETRLTRYATGAEDTVTSCINTKANNSVNASLTVKRGAETQPSRKKIILMRRTKIINLIMRVLLRLAL